MSLQPPPSTVRPACGIDELPTRVLGIQPQTGQPPPNQSTDQTTNWTTLVEPSTNPSTYPTSTFTLLMEAEELADMEVHTSDATNVSSALLEEDKTSRQESVVEGPKAEDLTAVQKSVPQPTQSPAVPKVQVGPSDRAQQSTGHVTSPQQLSHSPAQSQLHLLGPSAALRFERITQQLSQGTSSTQTGYAATRTTSVSATRELTAPARQLQPRNGPPLPQRPHTLTPHTQQQHDSPLPQAMSANITKLAMCMAMDDVIRGRVAAMLPSVLGVEGEGVAAGLGTNANTTGSKPIISTPVSNRSSGSSTWTDVAVEAPKDVHLTTATTNTNTRAVAVGVPSQSAATPSLPPLPQRTAKEEGLLAGSHRGASAAEAISSGSHPSVPLKRKALDMVASSASLVSSPAMSPSSEKVRITTVGGDGGGLAGGTVVGMSNMTTRVDSSSLATPTTSQQPQFAFAQHLRTTTPNLAQTGACNTSVVHDTWASSVMDGGGASFLNESGASAAWVRIDPSTHLPLGALESGSADEGRRSMPKHRSVSQQSLPRQNTDGHTEEEEEVEEGQNPTHILSAIRGVSLNSGGFVFSSRSTPYSRVHSEASRFYEGGEADDTTGKSPQQASTDGSPTTPTADETQLPTPKTQTPPPPSADHPCASDGSPMDSNATASGSTFFRWLSDAMDGLLLSALAAHEERWGDFGSDVYGDEFGGGDEKDGEENVAGSLAEGSTTEGHTSTVAESNEITSSTSGSSSINITTSHHCSVRDKYQQQQHDRLIAEFTTAAAFVINAALLYGMASTVMPPLDIIGESITVVRRAWSRVSHLLGSPSSHTSSSFFYSSTTPPKRRSLRVKHQYSSGAIDEQSTHTTDSARHRHTQASGV